jgi:hypothetical protein
MDWIEVGEMKVVHWAYQGGIFDHCVCGAESGAGIARGFFRPSGGKGGIVEGTGHPGAESGIARRNRNQSEQEQDRARPPPMATPQNLGIPTFRPHHNNQPLLAPTA